MLQIQKAVKEKIDLRAAITGPTGGGKTYTALRLAFALVGPTGKVLVIDTERKSARKYADESPDGFKWNYDVLELPDFSPSTYTEGIKLGIQNRYDVIIIDSMSHAWEGEGGILELQQKYGGRYQDWAKVNPLHFGLIDAILTAPCHMIVTMRSKMDYAMEDSEEGGKKKVSVVKLGMAPIQRAGVQYEFDFILDMDWTNTGRVDKTRCSAMRGKQATTPGPGFFQPLIDWLNTGEQLHRFDNVNQLFEAVKADFGIEPDEAKTIIKEAGYTSFKTSISQELYRVISTASVIKAANGNGHTEPQEEPAF